MFTKAFSTAAVALAAVGMVSAQTYTDCNPLKKTCPANPAFGSKKVNCDFTKGECDAFHSMIGTNLKYDGKGALFAINKESDAPTIRTDNYIFFGRVDVVVQAAEGQGVVTSAVLQSDDLDEVDWEWVGGDNAQVQSNYFSKGDTTTYDRAVYHPVAAPLTSTHKYSVEWTSTKIDWLIDDAIVRTLNAADAKGGEAFPQTPMQIKLGTWVAGGKNSNAGTREWAGGYTDFDDAPFNAYYKSVTITDYAGKDAAGQGAGVKEYVYGDKTGSWQSIKVKKGDSDDDDEETTTTSKADKTTTKATSTKTKSAEPTSTEDEESKTETEKETKTSDVPTTLATATTSKVSDASASATATATEGSGSGSGSGSSGDAQETGSSDGASSGDSGSETSSGDAAPSVSTVPVNSGSRMAGSIVAAAAGLFVAQLLI
ncbi:ice nucleation [Fusarium albosuccineum]|uniref:Crh-like protein n=1 Tax=Fusarium albosuccineum TaxID=1237068 RepID=A0A8H4LMJ3_9HYPO|nr:ice nucleation [Fusarium albosuccineum]